MKSLKLHSLSKKPSLFNISLGIIVIISFFIIIILTYYVLRPPPQQYDNTPSTPGITYFNILCNENTINYTNSLIQLYKETKDGQKFKEDIDFKIETGVIKSEAFIFSALNNNICDIGVLSRNLTLNETTSGFNQTIIAYNNTTKMPIVFVTKGQPSDDIENLINFTLSRDGQSLLENDSLIPLNNSSITA